MTRVIVIKRVQRVQVIQRAQRVQVIQPRPLVVSVSTLPQGLSGPNLVTGSTALDYEALPEAAGSWNFVVANPAGNGFARLDVSAAVRNLLAAETAEDARQALQLGPAFRGEKGDKGDRGDKGDKGDPGEVCDPTTSATCEPDADLVVESVISAAVVDADGCLIDPAGLVADGFWRNPVVLWNHDATLPPIGQCVSLRIEGGLLIAVTRFARGVPFAEEVFRLYQQGVLTAWSIGYRVLSQRETAFGTVIDRWELVEYSAVPLPANSATRTIRVEETREDVLADLVRHETDDVFSDLIHGVAS